MHINIHIAVEFTLYCISKFKKWSR